MPTVPIHFPNGRPPPCCGCVWRGAAALGVAAYLLWASFMASGRVAGCGEDSGCEQVLASRWSQWLRLPVALPAAVVYALALIALFEIQGTDSWLGGRRAWQLLVVLAAVLVGSACWFLGLQALAVGEFCGYCLAAHACGLLLAGFIVCCNPLRWRAPAEVPALLLAGLCGTSLLIAGQVLVEPRAPDMRVQARVELKDGNVTFDPEKHPRLGSPRARFVLVELYDYTCEHCRVTTGYLEEARRRYGDQLAILPLVVPYHPDCNPHAHAASLRHEHACVLARLALAVWRAKPQAFESFHLWLIESPPDPDAARRRAAELVGADALAQALADPALDQQLAEHVRLYARAGAGTLPILLHGSQTAQGRPPGAKQLFQFLERNVGLPPP